MPSRLVITFLPRSKRLLTSWLQSPSAVILEPEKIKSDTVSIVSPSISMNQGKLEVVKQKMVRVNINILGISELKCTGMGKFNSDNLYIYYCGQEYLRRNGVAIIVKKRVQNAVLGCNLKNVRMISVRFQGKPFSITIIQVYAPTSNAEEAEVEWFCEDLQDLLELTPKKDVLFIIGDWNAKVGSQEILVVTGKFGLGVQNEAGQKLTEFCQENALVIANTHFQQYER